MPTRARTSTRPPIFLRCTVSLTLLTALGCNGDPEQAADADPEQAAAEGAAQAGATDAGAGEIVAISGPGGVGSPSLPPGAFLGKGATLTPGQDLRTAKGTLAELRLPGGIRVRMNEDTELSLPGSGAASRLVLAAGEIVVLTEPGSTAELSIASGDEVLTLTRGEVQVRNDGPAAGGGPSRRYAVVSGSATLTAPSRSLTLGAGESIEAPLPEERTRQPELSLAPLQQTGWSRTFESAAEIAKQVPAGVGSLTARRPGSQAQKQRLRLTDQSVHVSIAGRIAHTEIEQAFFNDAPAVLEGTYRFALPGDGSVSGLGLLVGNRWMEGEIVEKTRARRIFRSIVDATIPRDPALLEWDRGNLFKLKIFPIPGRGERRVRLAYTQVLPVAGESLQYRFPLAGSGAGGTEIENFDFRVTIDGDGLDEATLADIGTPMMDFARSVDNGRLQLVAEREHFVPTADIGVDIPLPAEQARVQTATHLDRDGQAYFMVSMQPQIELPRPEGPTSFAFVLDRSHSTSPELWTVARGMVEALTTSMEPDDRFTVLACDTACDQAPGGMLAAQPGDLDELSRFFERQDLAGASDLGGMLTTAALALERGGATGQRVIVYLGDGTPTSGEMAADQLARHVADPLRGTRVMAVALGSRSDVTTLNAIVQQTGGDVLRADPRDDRLALVRELRLRARVPVANDVQIETPDGMAAIHRHGGQGLRPGDSLVLVGKLAHPVDGDIVVRTPGENGPVEARFPVKLEADRSSPVEHRHLPRTWAQAEIAELTRTKGFDAREQIVALSKHYTVMSRHTSLLVLENDAMYREFNVVRAAKNTDKWDGKLSAQAQAESKLEEKPVEEDELGALLKNTEERREAGNTVTGSAAPSHDHDLRTKEERRNRDDSGADAPQSGVLGGVPGGVPGGVAGGIVGGEKAKDDPRPFEPSPEPEPDPFPGNLPLGDEDFGNTKTVTEAAEPSDVEFEDDDFDVPTGGGSAPAAPPPASKPKPKKKKAASSSGGLPSKRDEPFSDPWSGGGSASGKGRGGPWTHSRRPTWHPPRLKTRPVGGPDSRSLARVESLRHIVDASPTQRSAHGKLVRAALRADHPESLAFARAWAVVDPDHAPALLSLADAMAADGDPMALRAYESALEVQPFSERHHRELARAYESKGDLRRACSHRQAVVSIDPQQSRHHAELARCLGREGQVTAAARALADGRTRALDSQAELNSAEAEHRAGRITPASFDLHGGAQLRATLTWSGGDDLDLAVVDAKGRRLSGLRPQGKVRVRESSGREELTLKKVRKSVFIEVTRPGRSRAIEAERGPISGVLEVKTPGGTKRVPFTIREGTLRVARVFWTRGGRR